MAGLIFHGNVTLNGRTVKSGSEKADADSDEIKVCGEIFTIKKHIYIMLNKPKGVVSASDGKGERTVCDLVPEELMRRGLFPAGRLDKDTTGFVLITDDGEFAHRSLFVTISKKRPFRYSKTALLFVTGRLFCRQK